MSRALTCLVLSTTLKRYFELSVASFLVCSLIFAEYKGGFKNKAFQSLEAVIGKSQEAIQGLERSVVKRLGQKDFNFRNSLLSTLKIDKLDKKTNKTEF